MNERIFAKEIMFLLEFLEYNLHNYITYVNKLKIPIRSDIVILDEDLNAILSKETVDFLLKNNIIMRNPVNPRIVEIVNLNLLLSILQDLINSKRYSVEISKFKRKEEIFYELLKYIAPNVKNTSIISKVKKVMLLQLASDSDKGFRTRIHIAMIGAPGTGKTLLLQYQADVSQGLYVSLKTTSAGLAGSLNPEHFESTPPLLKLADKKILCIDEADKIKIAELDPLLLAMEEGKVVLSGANIRLEYPARVRVFIASNRQTMRPELADRFDLIATFPKPSKKEIKDIIGHIIEFVDNEESIMKSKEIIKRYIQFIKAYEPRIINKQEVSQIISQLIESFNVSTGVRDWLRWLRFAYAYAKITRTDITPKTITKVFQILNESNQ